MGDRIGETRGGGLQKNEGGRLVHKIVTGEKEILRKKTLSEVKLSIKGIKELRGERARTDAWVLGKRSGAIKTSAKIPKMGGEVGLDDYEKV